MVKAHSSSLSVELRPTRPMRWCDEIFSSIPVASTLTPHTRHTPPHTCMLYFLLPLAPLLLPCASSSTCPITRSISCSLLTFFACMITRACSCGARLVQFGCVDQSPHTAARLLVNQHVRSCARKCLRSRCASASARALELETDRGRARWRLNSSFMSICMSFVVNSVSQPPHRTRSLTVPAPWSAVWPSCCCSLGPLARESGPAG
jgi:hypothetical protein